MSFSTTDTDILYDGDGSDTTFEIPFDYVSEDHVKVRLYDISDVENITYTDLVKGTGWEFVDEDTIRRIEIQLILGEPTPVAIPVATTERILIWRDTIDHHPTPYSGYSFPPSTISTDFDRIYQRAQELEHMADRAIKYTEYRYHTDGTLLTGDEVEDQLADHEERITDLEEAGVGGGSSIGPFDGFSLRYNELFDNLNLEDTLLQILQFGYLAPSVSLSASPAQSVRERGDTSVTAVNLTATTSKNTNDITSLEYYKNGALMSSEAAPAAAGGAETDTDNSTLSTTTTYYAVVGDGTGTSQSNTVTFTYVYPYYYGNGSPGLTAAQVAALTKDIRTSNANLNVGFTSNDGDVWYFAYPASYGPLTSILDESGFETIADWTLRTENITGLDGNAVSYRIYEFNNPVVAYTTDYTFIR